MVSYDFACKKCELVYEVNQSIKDDLPTKCEFCNCSNPEQFFQIIGCPTFFVKQDPTTVHWQADRNTQRIGKAELSERAERKKEAIRKAREEMAEKVGGKAIRSTNGPKPAWREKLDLGKISNIRKYIETGQK